MKGTSYTYFTTDNAKSARDLVAILKEANAEIPPQLEEMTMFGGGGGGRGMFCFIIDVRPFLTGLLSGRYGGGGGRGGGRGGRGGGGGYGGGGGGGGYGGRTERW